MNCYICTKFENQHNFHDLKEALESEGHSITHDWTKESEEGKTGDERCLYLQDCAEKDFYGVLAADATIFLTVPGEQLKGAYVEMGMALAAGIKVIVVDAFNPLNQRNIFNYLPDVIHVKTLSHAVAVLRDDI